MVRQVIGRTLAAGTLLATLGAPLIVTAGAAAAAPVHAATGNVTAGGTWPATVPAQIGAQRRAPAPPNGVTITSEHVRQFAVYRTDKPEMLDALLEQVRFLRDAPVEIAEPARDKRGPKYTVTVYTNDQPAEIYDLYPLAAGGPRAYRPASQPDRKTEAGWFFGRVTMGEALRAAGAPLPPRRDVMTGGGIGGGENIGKAAEVTDARKDIDQVLTRLRQVLLLNVGVLLVITLGLAGMSLLIRRRV